MEPRRRLFKAQDTDLAKNGQHSEFLHNVSSDLPSTLAFTNSENGTVELAVNWDFEDKENMPDFYSRPPKRKLPTNVCSDAQTLTRIDFGPISPLRKKFKRMNIKPSKQSGRISKGNASIRSQKRVRMLEDITNTSY
ncbi:unnamed protein product [Hydatigera taeniaeformis]|uniref:PAX3-and PAX7-binding protein 1 n=1 Tax=Hydatigena taeniaeformis TaxID=6205 RepID=A0A0R3WYM7_HYDTA|nr:unnamed protein product [Hydatigera taeniaeformis]